MWLLPLEAKTRRAVVIGLGEQLDKSWRRINGDKDVPLVTSMLKSNGFTDIKTLVNSQATKDNIIASLKSLISRTEKGDIVYIHFSGHGQRITDVNGDETDGWDESWIPYDAYKKYCAKDRGERHLSDDEIAMYMTQLRSKIGKNGTIAVVVDACHSGDSTRGLEGADSVVVRGVYSEFVIPDKAKNRVTQAKETWLTLSACQDYQLNQEYNGFGKLTYIITNNWRRFRGHSDKAIYNIINETMQSRGYKGDVAQNPRLSGEAGIVLSIIFNKK